MPTKRPAIRVSRPACAGLCLGLCLLAACAVRWPPPREREYFAHTLDPERIPGATLPPPLLEHTRTMRVRAFADEAYREQNPQWLHHIRTLFAQASVLTQRQFGARFELLAVERWPPPPTSEPTLALALAALERLAPTEDAEWVVGFVGAKLAWQQDEAGATRQTGHHIVLRGSLQPPLEAGADDDAVQLLRQWGLSLAAPPDAAVGWILSQQGQPDARAFSAASVRIIAIGLDFHGYRSPEGRRTWASVVQDAARHSADDTDDAVWRAALEWAESVLEDGQPQRARELPDGQEASTRPLVGW